MDQTSEAEQEEDAGAPAWVMTFADLMSLLMCFFVLLLSFSEMDVQKFKQIAGSMKMAFGVQRDVQFKMIPKGTSVIAQEFSPGKPTPTPLKELRQTTTDETKDNLDFTDSVTKEAREEAARQLKEDAERRLEQSADEVSKVLKEEVDKGLLAVKTKDGEVIIRIREKGSFPSGAAKLRRSFYPTLKKIGEALNAVDGQVIVAGHTDNIPIATRQYPSNWVLSAARAATVVHFLSKHTTVDENRLQIRAHAETKALSPNATEKGRAQNRRVEIVVRNQDWSVGPLPENTQIVRKDP